MSFSLNDLPSDETGRITSKHVLGAIHSLDDAQDLSEAMNQLSTIGEMMPSSVDTLAETLGTIEALGAVITHPKAGNVRTHTRQRAFVAMERLRGIANASTSLQVQDAQRPNVFLEVRFQHTVAGTLNVNDLKPSLPAQNTIATPNGPLVFIQMRTYVLSGAYSSATLDIQVSRVGFAQYAAPVGGPVPTGLPIEQWAPHAYRNGIHPPAIRGLERADSNTVIGFTSTASVPVDYLAVIEFKMLAFLGGQCARIMPSLTRGPLNIVPPPMRGI